MAYNIKQGDTVYLKKTGEKFNIIRKTPSGFEIADEGGTEFYGVKENEFKKPKDNSKKLFEEINKKETISEKDVLLIKRRLNNKKIDLKDVPYDFDDSKRLTKEQEDKGAKFLLKNPDESGLSYREKTILADPKREAFLVGFTNVSLYDEEPYYEPVYLYTGSEDSDGHKDTFEYYYHNGKVNITG